MGCDARKPVVGVSDQDSGHTVPKLNWLATETSKHSEISHVASFGMILSHKRTTKTLIRLHGCTG